jgi:hypothetical protein
LFTIATLGFAGSLEELMTDHTDADRSDVSSSRFSNTVLVVLLDSKKARKSERKSS